MYPFRATKSKVKAWRYKHSGTHRYMWFPGYVAIGGYDGTTRWAPGRNTTSHPTRHIPKGSHISYTSLSSSQLSSQQLADSNGADCLDPHKGGGSLALQEHKRNLYRIMTLNSRHPYELHLHLDLVVITDLVGFCDFRFLFLGVWLVGGFGCGFDKDIARLLPLPSV